MLTVDMENKENGSLDVKNSVENGRPLDPADWAVTDVVNYFRTAGFEEQASAFQEQEIDGKSLLLMTRNDVLTGLSLKLGPALKIYEYHRCKGGSALLTFTLANLHGQWIGSFIKQEDLVLGEVIQDISPMSPSITSVLLSLDSSFPRGSAGDSGCH
ncbi:hypothetical protein Nmel_010898 [Mimus melanotis]